jgi:hypothetical protein
VRRCNESPTKTKAELETLQLELQSFERMLPVHLKVSTERLLLILYMDNGEAIIMLHNMWLQCHCDLHRFLIPGLREAVRAEIVAETPMEYIEYCQRICLHNATRLCKLWSQLRHMEFRPSMDNISLFISIYQVTQIIHHLKHLLPVSGQESLGILKANLNEAIQLTEDFQDLPASVARWREDAQKAVQVLGTEVRTAIDSEDENVHHLPSRHSLIPKDPDLQHGTGVTKEPVTLEAFPVSCTSEQRAVFTNEFAQVPNTRSEKAGLSSLFSHDELVDCSLFDMQWDYLDNVDLLL